MIGPARPHWENIARYATRLVAHHMSARTNRVAAITAKHQVGWETGQPVAHPGPGELLIRTGYSLISPGTELAMFNRTHIGFSDSANRFARYPFYPGYCAAGVVVECGSRADTPFRPGDRVFYSGKHQAWSVVSPKAQLLSPIPDELPARFAPLARMAQIAATASVLAEFSPGCPVCVVGLGLVGNLAAQIFQLRGARVVAIDPVAERVRIAESCSVEARTATADEAPEALQDAFGSPDVPVVVEATGHPAVVEPTLRLVARGGQALLLGSTRGRVDLDVYDLIHRPGIVVRGAHMMTIPVHSDDPTATSQQHLVREMLDHFARGALACEPLISDTIQPESIADAYHRLNDDPANTLSIVLDWTDAS